MGLVDESKHFNYDLDLSDLDPWHELDSKNNEKVVGNLRNIIPRYTIGWRINFEE